MEVLQNLPDKYKFTPAENQRYARANLAQLVHTSSRFEGVTTTLPQTKTIIDGMSVQGVPVEDILTIVNLKRGWQYITNLKQPLDLNIEKEINRIVAAEDSLEPGEFRSGAGNVDLGLGKSFEPPLVNEKQEQDFLSSTLQDDSLSTTDRALTIMYHNMRNQIFWDGNKRSAILAANKVMIDGGAGLINVPLNKWNEWNTLISDYYRTGKVSKLKKWTYDNGVQGVGVRENKILAKQPKTRQDDLSHNKGKKR
ncbi:Fic family protein [Fructilactobacillus cliffordii]|uniref:Fic family protein n=1 Tax=Fructilactobacillus cliffordii TaxID=2940299 RepID=A0A9Q8ZV74_9LACO|nr:Fic family protein [Fructilactobacillus cliffordii]USS90000.1 Fic family protein [Fructilactobacillus cliffordii]